MSWIETTLTRLEAHLRLLIEGDADHTGFPRRLHHLLERGLIRVMKSETRQVQHEASTSAWTLTAPDQYTLVLPTLEAQVLLAHPTELDRLASKLVDLASQAGIAFVAAPILRVVPDPQSTEMSILAEFRQSGMEESSTFQLEGAFENSYQTPSEKLPNAYLIVNGLSTFPITSRVVNIGSDSSNHLQLDDPHISRLHSQLRLVQGQFVIFDLDSRGGTFVNGVPISSHVLNPGDVIQLAGIPLVYGQEVATSASQTQELPVNPAPPEVL